MNDLMIRSVYTPCDMGEIRTWKPSASHQRVHSSDKYFIIWIYSVNRFGWRRDAHHNRRHQWILYKCQCVCSGFPFTVHRTRDWRVEFNCFNNKIIKHKIYGLKLRVSMSLAGVQITVFVEIAEISDFHFNLNRSSFWNVIFFERNETV